MNTVYIVSLEDSGMPCYVFSDQSAALAWIDARTSKLGGPHPSGYEIGEFSVDTEVQRKCQWRVNIRHDGPITSCCVEQPSVYLLTDNPFLDERCVSAQADTEEEALTMALDFKRQYAEKIKADFQKRSVAKAAENNATMVAIQFPEFVE